MKKFIYIAILVILFSCKSTKIDRNNQLDVEKVKVENTENNIQLSQIDLKEKEIVIHTANPKEETIITDNKGNTQKFKNVKSITIREKTEQKKDSTASEKKDLLETVKDKSKIDETEESISDAKNFKGVFVAIAVIAICFLIVFLIIRFRIKAKKDNLV